MPASKEEVKSIVKQKLNLPVNDGQHDDLLGIYVDEAEKRIKHYCNIPEIPEDLRFTWASLAATAVAAEQKAILFPDPVDEEQFEISIGDTSVKTGKPAAAVQPMLVLDNMVFDYRAELNAFRRVRW
ncbi:phage head-tail connector protein [Paenibacillus gansuensis]|uniref:Phage head-tail connector protein n=1 Tax=Paenibacillus gansuensis TaxID=306542 RepID=A0ABW5PE53_9BACL